MKIKFNKKAKLSISLLLCTSALMFGANSAFAWDGTEVKEPSKEGDVYQIGSAEELAWFATETNKGKTIDAVLTKDIDLENYQWIPIGTGGFKGSFDGKDHNIKGFKIENGTGWQGFFGTNEGTIANFSINGNIHTKSGGGTGSITPWNSTKGIIDNVSSSVNVSSTNTRNIGGIAGQNTLGGVIKNSEFSGTVNSELNTSATQHVGGITGTNNSAFIIGNINYGNVQGTNASKQIRIGGIIGTWDSKDSSTVANNINYGNISSNSNFARIGGLVGFYNNTVTGNASVKDIFINSINFGKVSADQPTSISDTINSKEDLEKDKYFNSKNIYDSNKNDFDAKKSVETINNYDGSEHQISIPDSAKFNLSKDGSVKLTSQLNRSKEEPVDEEKLKEAQKYLEKAAKALKDSWYKSTPEFGKDTNVNTMVEKALSEKGFKDIKVSVKNTADEEYVGKDGTVHYYYKNPNESDFMRFRAVSVDYELQKDGASTIYEKVNTVVHWDRDKLTKITNEEITDQLTLEAIKDKNDSTEKFDKDLLLPKHVDNKKWAEVKWYSSDENLIKIDNSLQTGGANNLSKPYIGKIKRGEKDQKVTLYATVHNNFIQNGQPELVIEKELEVTIKGLGAESKDEIQALMDEHYTFDKMKDAVTKGKLDPENVTNDIGLPIPKSTGVPLSHLYKFTAESHTPDVLTANGYRLAVLRPLPGEPAKKASFTVTMADRNSSLSAKKTFEVTIQPISQKEIDDEIKLMDAVKANYFNGLNKIGNSDPSNITERLNIFQQASFKEDGKTINWVYDQKDLKDKGIVPVSIDLAKPSEQWDRFHSSNNTILQHESLALTKPKYDTKVTVTSCLSSSTLADYAKAYPENKELQKIYRQPVSVDLIVKGTKGENPNPEEKRKVTFSIIGEKKESSYNNWLVTNGEGNESTSVFDIFKTAMDKNGYTFVGSNYISSITTPGGFTLAHKEQGPGSGWMYAVNGDISDLMPADYIIEDGDQITWFYVVDYTTDPRIKNNKFIPDTNVETDLEKAARLIKAIGDVTLEKEDAIKEAREAINNVKGTNHELIVLYAQLELKEIELAKLKQEVQNKDAAKKVEDLINEIGNVDLSSEKSITDAFQAYDELSDDAKKLVTNFDTLENAKQILLELIATKENEEAANIVMAAIDSIKEPTMADKAAVELARNKFNTLTPEQQKLVTNVDSLKAFETTIQSLTNDIANVIKGIEALPETISLDNKEAVIAAINTYNALPETSKLFITNSSILDGAKKQLEILEAVTPVETLITAIGNVTLSSEQAINDARKAFNELTPELQIAVANLETLEKAEATLKELKEAEIDNSKKELTKYKEQANKELTSYKKSNDYRKEQQKELTQILAEAKIAIEKADDKATVDKISNEIKAKLDKVKTDKDFTNEEKIQQGPWIKDGRFVTIKKKGYKTWSNFNWKQRNKSDKMLGITYHSKGKYNHKNGETYLSIFDNNDNWHGYINEKAIKVVSGKQGDYIKDGRFVTISNNYYETWSNFAWKKHSSSKTLINKTFEARAHYKHMNGETYLSIYDGKGKWHGYINANATKLAAGKQGAYIKDGRKVTINKKGYSTWSNFNWKKRSNSTKLMNQSFTAKGRYQHINGETYYSLYDNKGNWHGYINKNAVK